MSVDCIFHTMLVFVITSLVLPNIFGSLLDCFHTQRHCCTYCYEGRTVFNNEAGCFRYKCLSLTTGWCHCSTFVLFCSRLFGWDQWYFLMCIHELLLDIYCNLLNSKSNFIPLVNGHQFSCPSHFCTILTSYFLRSLNLIIRSTLTSNNQTEQIGQRRHLVIQKQNSPSKKCHWHLAQQINWLFLDKNKVTTGISHS